MKKFNFEEYDIFKSKLLRWLKKQFLQINWKEFPKEFVAGRFEEIHSQLIEHWKETKREKEQKGWEKEDVNRLKGAFYEVLFYYTWYKFICLERAMKIIDEKEFNRWETLPLQGPILPLFYTENIKERIAPQIDADFLILHISGNKNRIEIHRPLLVDVKSSPKVFLSSKKLDWQAVGAKYLECEMSITFPKIEFPKELEDWDYVYICPNCGGKSKDSRECSNCGFLLSWITFFEKIKK